jgi:hypothetical protein
MRRRLKYFNQILLRRAFYYAGTRFTWFNTIIVEAVNSVDFKSEGVLSLIIIGNDMIGVLKRRRDGLSKMSFGKE